ncbi:hypothetical protein ACFL6G_07080 [candidate division KSB1 bacterium]
MSAKNYCKHRNLVYLGIQTIDGFDKELTLYNCLDCKSTISVESDKRRAYGRLRNIHKQNQAKIIPLNV